MTQTALILGASGRFGRHTTRAFVAAGWQGRSLGRQRPKSAGTDSAGDRAGQRDTPPPLEHEWIDGDAGTPGVLESAATGATVIVNAMNPPYAHWQRQVPVLAERCIAAACTSGALLVLPGNVYNLGACMPAVLSESSRQAPTTALGEIRVRLEASFQQAAHAYGIRCLIVRAGDFVEGRRTGNWFEDHLLKHIARGRLMYPGPLDRQHAWAYLPDLARAVVALVEQRDALSTFQSVGFPGWTLTGQQLLAQLEQAAGRDLKLDTMPWWLLQFLGLGSANLRGVVSLRYLWDRQHAIDPARFNALLPAFESTPIEQALGTVVAMLVASGPSQSG